MALVALLQQPGVRWADVAYDVLATGSVLNRFFNSVYSVSVCTNALSPLIGAGWTSVGT